MIEDGMDVKDVTFDSFLERYQELDPNRGGKYSDK